MVNQSTCINYSTKLKQNKILAAASVLMRQTNVVWIGMAFGTTTLDLVTKNYAEFKKIKTRDVKLYKPKVSKDNSMIKKLLLFFLKNLLFGWKNWADHSLFLLKIPLFNKYVQF